MIAGKLLTSFGEILADRSDDPDGKPPLFTTYRVPPFQRDYAWTIDEWTDLWLDLEDLQNEEKNREESGHSSVHYMGHLILTPENGDAVVVDGQQRLTTLTILMLACADRLGAGVNGSDVKSEGDILQEIYAGRWNPVTQSVPAPRLVLNRNDDMFFRHNVLKRNRPISFSRRPRSNRLLWDALEFFREKLSVSQHGDAQENKDNIKRLVNIVDKRLVFTVLQVEDELSAYRVFETLNARGMDLSAGDLIKNRLLFMSEEGLQSEMERRWNNAEKEVGGSDMAAFIACLWNSEREMARGRDLYRKIRGGVRNADDAFQFMSKVESDAPIYRALREPPPEWWGNKKIAQTLAVLSNDLGARQHLPMLLAARRLVARKRLSGNEFHQLARWAEIAHFRHITIAKQSSDSLEAAHNQAAIALSAIAADENAKAAGQAALPKILQILRSATVNDNVFQQHFQSAEFDARDLEEKKIVRYALRALEERMGGTGDLRNPGVEHILPVSEKARGDNWPEFPPEEHESYARRLGNYCLLTEEDNRMCGDKPYDGKKPVYKRSQYRTASEWTYDEWTPERLLDRQERMAKLAAEIWRLAE